MAFESPAAQEMVRADATNRIGQLAVTAMSKHGSNAIDIWQVWAARDPQAQAAMLKGIFS